MIGELTNGKEWKKVIVCSVIANKEKIDNRNLEETYMADFIVNLFAEIADFFITFWVDNVIDKFAKRNK